MERKRFRRAKSGVKAGELVDRLPFHRLLGPCGFLPTARWELGRRLGEGKVFAGRWRLEVLPLKPVALTHGASVLQDERLPGGDRRSRRAAFPGTPTLK